MDFEHINVNFYMKNIRRSWHIEHRTSPQRWRRWGPFWNMLFCIFCLEMRKTSTYAKHGKEIFTCALNYAAKSIRIQLSPYFRIWFLVPARNCPSKEKQRWRRFLFCLQPTRLAGAAKYSRFSLRRISLLLAFPAKYHVVLHSLQRIA